MENNLQELNCNKNIQIWSARIEQCRNSGKSVKSWCSENGIKTQTFYYWQKKLYQLLISSQQEFSEIPVDIIGKDSASEERIAKISTVDFELNLYSGASPEQITALLAGMKRC